MPRYVGVEFGGAGDAATAARASTIPEASSSLQDLESSVFKMLGWSGIRVLWMLAH